MWSAASASGFSECVPPPRNAGIIYTAGAVSGGLDTHTLVCVVLGVLRLRFLWWPFHPVGYILSNSLPVAYGLFPFFIVWVVKVVVTRYGGLRLYRSTLPLATGLVVGDILNTTTWNIVALATQGRL